jgi:hypothetical protein
VWVAFIILFFTKSNSKLPGYIVPVFPAVALLVANYLDVGTRRSRMLTAGLTALLGAGLLGFVPFMLRLARHAGEAVLYAAYQPWALAAGLVLLIGGALAMLYARQMQRDLTVLVLAIAGFAGTQLLLAGFEPIGQVRAGTNLLPALKAAGAADPATRVYSVGIYEQSLTFYLNRTVTLVDYVDEFSFGLEQQPELAIPTIPAFVQQWRQECRGRREERRHHPPRDRGRAETPGRAAARRRRRRPPHRDRHPVIPLPSHEPHYFRFHHFGRAAERRRPGAAQGRHQCPRRRHPPHDEQRVRDLRQGREPAAHPWPAWPATRSRWWCGSWACRAPT